MSINHIIKTLEQALYAEPQHELLVKPENHALISQLVNTLYTFRNSSEPFVVFFQAGAGAPVGDFIEDWKAAGLAGCTREIMQLASFPYNFVVINSMTATEQQTATYGIKNQGIDLNSMPIFNDPDRILFTLLEMEPSELKTVQNRTAYIPQAMIFTADGVKINKTQISNEPLIPGTPRDPDAYLARIEQVLNAQRKSSQQAARAENSLFPAATITDDKKPDYSGTTLSW